MATPCVNDLLTDAKYLEIAGIISGGVADNFESGLPTGIIGVRSLRDLHHKHPEIDWQRLGNDRDALQCPRLVHLAKLIVIAFRRRTWEPIPLGETSLKVVHLNTHVQIPLFSPLATGSIEASPLPYYGLPAVYVSAVRHNSNGNLELSEGSMDIIRERAARKLSYSRGVIFEIDPKAVFQIDRKANVAYSKHFMDKVLKTTPELAPQESVVLRHAARLDLAAKCTDPAGVLSDAEFDSLIEIGRELKFSVLGACLFEATHEFLMEHVDSLRKAREVMFALDPSQKELWSMHAFGLAGQEEADRVMVDHSLPAGKLAGYLKVNVVYKLRAYVGAMGEYAKACAFDCEFGRQNYELVRSGDGDPAVARLSQQIPQGEPLNDLGLALAKDGTGRPLLRFGSALTSEQLSKALKHATTRGWGLQLEAALRVHRYKTQFNRYLDQVSANTLKVLVHHDLGCLAVPFQPDPRGELLLVPTANRTSIIESRRMQTRENSQLIELEGDLEAPVLVRNRSGFDPQLQHSNPLWYSRNRNLADAYGPLFELIARRIESQLPPIVDSLPEGGELSFVVIPFFKERDSYVGVARQSLLATRRRSVPTVIVFVSNQAPADFTRNVIHAEAQLAPELRRSPPGSRLVSINTAEVRELSHWMIEKYINVHAGLHFACALVQRTGRALREVAVLEGDVHNVEPWWGAYLALPRPRADVVIFQPKISIVDESSKAKRPAGLDTSDTAMAKLFCGPLSVVLLGCNAQQLLGGNYVLSGKAVCAFLEHLKCSGHSESLIETWLLPLAAGGLSMHLLNVSDKEHFSTDHPQLTGSNRKLIKWVGDLFYSFDCAIELANPQSVPVVSILADEPVRYLVAAGKGDWKNDEWVAEATRGNAVLWPVVREVLPEQMVLKYEALAGAVLGNAASLPRRSRRVTNDDWMETVVHFFIKTRGKRREEVEEMFALRFLFVLFTLSRVNEREGVLDADLNLSQKRILACRKLVSKAI